MIKIPTKKDDMLEIYEDNGKYILKYPTFNITMPEVTQEISKESVDSYLRGEHTGEELINYAASGKWKPSVDSWHATRQYLIEHPEDILVNIKHNKQYFSDFEFRDFLKKSLFKKINIAQLDSIGVIKGNLELLLVDTIQWMEEIESIHIELLQEKINNYIHYLESKQYVEKYGDNFKEKVIHVTFQYAPSDNGLAFLVQVQKVLQSTDMSLKVTLPD